MNSGPGPHPALFEADRGDFYKSCSLFIRCFKSQGIGFQPFQVAQCFICQTGSSDEPLLTALLRALTCVNTERSSDASLALVSAVAKKGELHRGHLSYPELPLPEANYRLLEPLRCMCSTLGPHTGVR